MDTPSISEQYKKARASYEPEARVTMGTCAHDFPGIEEILTATHTWPLEGALPLSRSGIEGRYIDRFMNRLPREVIAYIEDFNLWRMSQAEAILNLLMGEVLSELKKGKVSQLGYIRMEDYCLCDIGAGIYY